MMTIKTYLGKSTIHGTGVFAAEDIKKGQLISTYVEGFDRRFTEADIMKLPEAAINYLEHYAYTMNGVITFPADNDRFTNHSESPNTKTLHNGDVVALADIRKGEEITCSYNDFDVISWDYLDEGKRNAQLVI